MKCKCGHSLSSHESTNGRCLFCLCDNFVLEEVIVTDELVEQLKKEPPYPD